jgi:hypothetical protein
MNFTIFNVTTCKFQNLTNSHKSDAAKHCNCTISEVEHILAKYSWAKQAQKKIEKLKEEGKPLPKSFSEVLTSSHKIIECVPRLCNWVEAHLSRAAVYICSQYIIISVPDTKQIDFTNNPFVYVGFCFDM